MAVPYALISIPKRSRQRQLSSQALEHTRSQWYNVEQVNTMFGTKVRLLLCISHPMLLNISVYHHQWDSHGTFSESDNPCLLSMLIGQAALIAATLTYLVRFPESIFPGRFDIYFNSHQIMHVLTLFTCIFARYT